MFSLILATTLAVGNPLPSTPPKTLGAIPTPAPLIFTVAGTGAPGKSADGDLAINTRLDSPQGVAVDRNGTIFVADSYNHVVRKVGPGGVSSVFASFSVPLDLAIGPDNSVYATGFYGVYRLEGDGQVVAMLGAGYGDAGDGGPATQALVKSPSGIAVDSSGNIYFADRASHRIRRIDTAGIITTVAGNGAEGSSGDGGLAVNASLSCPYDVAVDAAGRLYIADPCVGRLRIVETDGRIWTPLATSAGVWFVEVSPEGEVYFGSRSRGEIRKLDRDLTVVAGQIFTGYSGDGGPATSARLTQPRRLAFDRLGNLFVAEEGNHVIRKIVRSNRSLRRSDFDGDGASDLLWRNVIDGQAVAWMRWSGYRIAELAGHAGSSLVGNGDFDGDGTSDLLWRDPSSGRNWTWPAAQGDQSIDINSIAIEWDVTGIGDFDGDGKDDILWRHSRTGAMVMWPDGRAAGAIAAGTAKAVGFEVVDVNDYDGNGQDDVFWHDWRAGRIAIWFGGLESAEVVGPPLADQSWVFSGSGDFDGDGCADMLWRSLWGPVSVWKCGVADRSILLGDMDLGFRVAAIGDRDGDGKSEIFWRNARAGKNVIWPGGAKAKQVQDFDVDDSWEVIR